MPVTTPPNRPVNFTFINITTDTVRWQWQDNAANEKGFKIRTSSDNTVLYDLNQELPGTGGTTTWTELNLQPNTSYFRYVDSYNLGGSSSSISSGTYTLAKVPTGLAADSVGTNNITLECIYTI
jgi:hypothetical protein